MNRLELKIDVTGCVPIAGPLHIAASVYFPETSRLAVPHIAVFALPGGGYSRGYFDMHFAGHAGYSQAEHHVACGMIFVALDHLGVGDSSTTALQSLRMEDIAAADHAAVSKVADDLRDGRLAADLPQLPQLFRVGIGQSMGGCITLIMQGRHRSYDAVAPLGFSAIQTMLPQPDGKPGHGVLHGRAEDPAALSLAASTAQVRDFRYPFHWEDVPEAIVDADMKGGYPIRREVPPFGSATVPNCAIQMLAPGVVSEEAAAIDVPVLIAMGERDVCPRPHAEPSAFVRARDVGLYVVPRMAHMHNFASTRQLLWDRLAAWMSMLAH
ncbi:MAG: alpha/beta hydrolase [Gammaproteobacteria bacterium]